jgi:competence protein ComEA
MARLKKEQIILLIMIILVLVVGSGILIWQRLGNEAILVELNTPTVNNGPGDIGNKENRVEQEVTEKEEKTIIVHVAGEIALPGVYELPEEARVYDAIKAAGGETLQADLDRMNLAAFICDGQRIYIPAVKKDNVSVEGSSVVAEEEYYQDNSSSSSSSNSGKVNINQASSEELQQLSGIGPSKAKSILDFRQKIGRFTDVKQLLEVSGIGEKTLEKISDEISLW